MPCVLPAAALAAAAVSCKPSCKLTMSPLDVAGAQHLPALQQRHNNSNVTRGHVADTGDVQPGAAAGVWLGKRSGTGHAIGNRRAAEANAAVCADKAGTVAILHCLLASGVTTVGCTYSCCGPAAAVLASQLGYANSKASLPSSTE